MPIGKRVRPVSGLSSWSRLSGGSPSRTVGSGAVADVIRVISITVAGAAPALDESAPVFPFLRSPAARTRTVRMRWNVHLTREQACLRRSAAVKSPHAGCARVA